MTSKIVSREPTQAMMDAAMRYYDRPYGARWNTRDLWRAMFDAAPIQQLQPMVESEPNKVAAAPAMEKPAEDASAADADEKLIARMRHAFMRDPSYLLCGLAADRIAELRAERDRYHDAMTLSEAKAIDRANVAEAERDRLRSIVESAQAECDHYIEVAQKLLKRATTAEAERDRLREELANSKPINY